MGNSISAQQEESNVAHLTKILACYDDLQARARGNSLTDRQIYLELLPELKAAYSALAGASSKRSHAGEQHDSDTHANNNSNSHTFTSGPYSGEQGRRRNSIDDIDGMSLEEAVQRSDRSIMSGRSSSRRHKQREGNAVSR